MKLPYDRVKFEVASEAEAADASKYSRRPLIQVPSQIQLKKDSLAEKQVNLRGDLGPLFSRMILNRLGITL